MSEVNSQAGVKIPQQEHIQPESPMMRINADNQEPLRFWALWIGLFLLMLLILLLAFALPPAIMTLSNQSAFKQFKSQAQTCNNPIGFDGANKIYCQPYSASNPTLGLITRDMSSLNQFILIFLGLGYTDAYHPVNRDALDQEVTLKVYELVELIEQNGSGKVLNFYRRDIIFNKHFKLKIKIKQDEEEEDDDNMMQYTEHEAEGIVALMRDINQEDTTLFFQLTFSNTTQLASANKIDFAGLTLSKRFTNFTFAIRYCYFIVAVIAAFIFLRRYFQIPPEERTLESRFVALGSVLLCAFNDPLYPATILKPNGFTAFTSVFVVVFFLLMILAIWMFFLRRILYEHGEKSTGLLQFRRSWMFALYFFVLYGLMLFLFLAYTFTSMKVPIVPGVTEISPSLKGMMVATAIILALGIAYVVVQFIRVIVKNCQQPGTLMWRHIQFVKMLPVFMILLFVGVVSLGFFPYSYSAQWILYGYSFMNFQMLLLEYLYYTPKVEVTNRSQELEIFSENYTIKSDVGIERQTDG